MTESTVETCDSATHHNASESILNTELKRATEDLTNRDSYKSTVDGSSPSSFRRDSTDETVRTSASTSFYSHYQIQTEPTCSTNVWQVYYTDNGKPVSIALISYTHLLVLLQQHHWYNSMGEASRDDWCFER